MKKNEKKSELYEFVEERAKKDGITIEEMMKVLLINEFDDVAITHSYNYNQMFYEKKENIYQHLREDYLRLTLKDNMKKTLAYIYDKS